MADLGSAARPPDPIRTERLVLRAPEARDRAAVIELNASPEVCAYMGGPRPRDELERTIPKVPKQRPGGFVVELDGTTVGIVTLERRDAEYEVRLDAGKVDLGYLFLPEAWGHGYAAESCAAALDWFASVTERSLAVCVASTTGSSGSTPSSGSVCAPRLHRSIER